MMRGDKRRKLSAMFRFSCKEEESMNGWADWIIDALDLSNVSSILSYLSGEGILSDGLKDLLLYDTVIFCYSVNRVKVVWAEMTATYGEGFYDHFFDGTVNGLANRTPEEVFLETDYGPSEKNNYKEG